MEKFLQVLMVLVLVVIGLSAMFSLRAHYMVWRYSPAMERLPRPQQPPAQPTE